ncbi:hypothetical protein CU097_015248 [Rhizopus azygosporus]|uniref:Uncharacterized protein n=1 Tax=Rhizopus azygosporus TaxID=86630 RepID=A0A367KCK7_RHIAZ|nr:hypothetical protein CU097_015248 [Rhizopus azygosporus]
MNSFAPELTRDSPTANASSHFKTTNNKSTVIDVKKIEREINEIRENAGQRPHIDELEAADPFNRLWSAVEPLMDRLSYSVTYPTSTFNHSEEEQEDEEMVRIRRELSAALHDCLPRANEKTDDERLELEDTKREYEELQQKLGQLQNQIRILEKKNMDNTALKSSIIQFKNDVHKQAKLLLQNQEHAFMTRSAIATGRTTTGGHSTAEIMTRIKELEEKNRNLRLQNRKLDAHLEKYRERFEKLKEGAKKRQQDV